MEASSSSLLPAAAHREELLSALRTHQVVICVGETGSGKTTQIPQYLFAAGYANANNTNNTNNAESADTNNRDTNNTTTDITTKASQDGSAVDGADGACIAVTQPRRVATVAVAQRVAQEMRTRVGGDGLVGYAIRFDDRCSRATKIKFLTDGVLVRECLHDPLLRRYAVVMLDEAHERSLHTDLLFGLLRQVLQRRPDLRLLITSATLHTARVASFFTTTATVTATALIPAILSIPGRAFPVEIFHAKQMQIMGRHGPLSPYVEAAVDTALQVHRSHAAEEGHLLVFLTGQQEIERACAELTRLTRDDEVPLHVLPLYGALSAARQQAIFGHTRRGSRKVIVATNVAETSLTIDGVRFVVDCGFTKQKAYNPATGMDALVVVPVSKSSAQQRAGRAGRTAPGKCFRLFAKDSYDAMMDESVPEILRTNLATTVLYLKVLGVHDVLGFAWLDAPEEDALLDALHQLWVLGALDSEGYVTTRGRLLAQFPLEPMLARAMIEAVALKCPVAMARIVAMLTVEDIFVATGGHRGRRNGGRGRENHGPDEDQDCGEESGTERDQVMLRLTREDLVDEHGDLLTYGRVLTAFSHATSSGNGSSPNRVAQMKWCEERGLRFRALSTAEAVARQLMEIVETLSEQDVKQLRTERNGHGADESTEALEFRGEMERAMDRSETTRLRRAACAGFFPHAVCRCSTQSNVYRAMEMVTRDQGDAGNSSVRLLQLHPQSVLHYVAPPACCVYQELVATSRPFMRGVLQVEPRWVRFYSKGKTELSTDLLYHIGGRAAAVALDNVAPPKDISSDLPGMGNAADNVADTKDKKKQDMMEAARARFLARKVAAAAGTDRRAGGKTKVTAK